MNLFSCRSVNRYVSAANFSVRRIEGYASCRNFAREKNVRSNPSVAIRRSDVTQGSDQTQGCQVLKVRVRLRQLAPCAETAHGPAGSTGNPTSLARSLRSDQRISEVVAAPSGHLV